MAGTKNTYKSIKDHNAKSGNNTRRWQYFDTKGTTLFFRGINRGPAEAQSVSKKIKLTWFASVHECSLRVDLLLREVRELLKLALITPIRGSIRMRSSGQIGTESLGVRHCDCSSDALRRRRISFHESPTGTYPISWATNTLLLLLFGSSMELVQMKAPKQRSTLMRSEANYRKKPWLGDTDVFLVNLTIGYLSIKGSFKGRQSLAISGIITIALNEI
ncbi:hypothetical protein G5I_06320 [Acromyrmex echinatior]|uniref:Uncharacterized protein n=1 Tax=Acromyrmex echinatior TaxID=103372 RepID=F4WKQ0_ACREC|nr:hypothetical protein G5I_06320 [Acromyrmex echinatior]